MKRTLNQGTFFGSIVASEKTAAAAGAIGELRRDPMAMLPFCGYNMADYWQHWIDIGAKEGAQLPKIFMSIGLGKTKKAVLYGLDSERILEFSNGSSSVVKEPLMPLIRQSGVTNP